VGAGREERKNERAGDPHHRGVAIQKWGHAHSSMLCQLGLALCCRDGELGLRPASECQRDECQQPGPNRRSAAALCVPERKHVDLLAGFTVVEPVANPGEQQPSDSTEVDVGGGRTQTYPRSDPSGRVSSPGSR
jgi:hypothetical protein